MQINQQNFEAVQLLELFISCRSLDDLDTYSVSDPFVILFMKNEQKWTKMGQTELIWNNLNPNFAQSLKIEYHFETQQHLKFEVHHYIDQNNSKIIGNLETTVSQIAGSKDQIYMGDLTNQSGNNSGKLIVKADQVKRCNDDLQIEIFADKIKETRFWFWHSTNPFLRFYRLRKDDTTPILVYETEYLQDKKSGTWKPIICKAQRLCNGDYQMPLKVELWDFRSSGKHLYLGESQISIQQLIDARDSNKQEKREMRNKSEKEPTGIIYFKRFSLFEKPSFWDFLSGGLQLNMILAIDYTASNKNPFDQKSLHYMNPQTGQPSQYLQAIISVGEIVINYDYDKKVPVYGFGCKPHLNLINTNQTLHCFPINDNPDDPEVYGLEGIVQAYTQTISRLQFDGPTYLHPVLSEAMKQAKICKEQGSTNYLILMILTDGETHDMQASIDDVIASSHLPLSIIIIGIGDADFSKMEKLDNDDLSMVDSSGKISQRDLVQFVPFNQFKGDPALLAKEVLQELPDQVVEYMGLMKIKPKPPNNMNASGYYQQQQNNQYQPPPQQYQPPPQQFQAPPQQQGYQQNVLNDQQQQQFGQFQQQQQQQQQQYPYQQQQQKNGQATNILGQGLMKQGFLNNFITQANSQYNYPGN